MSTADPKNFIAKALAAISARVAASWLGKQDALRASAELFLEDASGDLARWTGLLSAGVISEADFRWLMKGRSDVAEIQALTLTGMTRADLDDFRAMVVETLVATAVAEVLGSKGNS